MGKRIIYTSGVLIILILLLLVAGCTKEKGTDAEVENCEVEEAYIYIEGFEWGPAVTRVVLKLNDKVSTVSAEDISLVTAGQKREVTELFLSNEKGQVVEGEADYITITSTTGYNPESFSSIGSPFTYNMETLHNEWSTEFVVSVKIKKLILDRVTYTLNMERDLINNRIVPDAEAFSMLGGFSGSYMNDFTGEMEEMALQTAAYEPETLAEGEQNPLVIWLHGQGEGGADPQIAILGNKVSALAQEEIQSYFTTNDVIGAYVLVIQSPTYWMDEGDGRNGDGSGVSRYTEILMDTISDYVATNPDIDEDRIYIGGCSNGGYMTLNMTITYPDYFAAAYPVCEAYAYSDKVQAIRDMPIWFVHAMDDTVVNPFEYSMPTYKALVDAGSTNAWFSMYENVVGTDSSNTLYLGHFSWIYLFNNQVEGVQDVTRIKNAAIGGNYGFEASNELKGGMSTATLEGIKYENIFSWLNAQTKK